MRPAGVVAAAACGVVCALVLAARGGAASSTTRHGRDASASAFRAESLAAGVWAIRPTATSGFGMDANSMLVVGSREALVVDAQFSASSTRAVIDIVHALTAKPVRWLVNTHWHDDHVS